MIAYLSGILLEKNPPYVIINVSGIGFEVQVSLPTFYQLPAAGEQVNLWIQAVYREDNQLLFGFSDQSEKTIFKQIVRVNGIGAKIALAVLSVLGSRELSRAVASKNIAALAAVPGIGKKTAERLILELSGKLMPPPAVWQAAADEQSGDIVATLLALGYSNKEAAYAVTDLPAAVELSTGVKLALQKLSK